MRTVTVAEFKRRFSELIGDVKYRGERIIIARRRTPVAAVVSLDDLERLGAKSDGAVPRKMGLLAAIGAWDDDEELDRIVKDIYAARERAVDRAVLFPGDIE
ncbi:MAG TPA: type II toxin-antitoxin system Phd/YefM family antitoxin [bacterium]|nr:type II toxin-antitoxin system Phd/YefM family antitoxin [bacterium]